MRNCAKYGNANVLSLVACVSKGLVVALRCSKGSGKALWRCVHIAAAASFDEKRDILLRVDAFERTKS